MNYENDLNECLTFFYLPKFIIYVYIYIYIYFILELPNLLSHFN